MKLVISQFAGEYKNKLLCVKVGLIKAISETEFRRGGIYGLPEGPAFRWPGRLTVRVLLSLPHNYNFNCFPQLV